MKEVQPLRNKRDITKLKDAVTGRDLLLVTIGLHMGMRISDILPLTIGDLRGQTHHEFVPNKTKNTKKRDKVVRVKISDEIRKLVDSLDGADEDLLFPSRSRDRATGDKRPITRQQADEILKSAGTRAGIAQTLSAHVLRKTFGYQAYRNGKGTPVEVLQKMFGHSTPKETLKYIGIVQDDMDEVVDNIDW